MRFSPSLAACSELENNLVPIFTKNRLPRILKIIDLDIVIESHLLFVHFYSFLKSFLLKVSPLVE